MVSAAQILILACLFLQSCSYKQKYFTQGFYAGKREASKELARKCEASITQLSMTCRGRSAAQSDYIKRLEKNLLDCADENVGVK